MVKDQNSGGKWSLEFSNLSSCSKWGHLWEQMRLLRVLSNLVMKSRKSSGCAAFLCAGLSLWEGIFSVYPIWMPLIGISTITSITPFCRSWQAAFRCPTTTTISATGWTSCSPLASADSMSAPSCRHLGVSPWNLGNNWLPQSTGCVAVLIQAGSFWLSFFKVSILAELFPAEMLSLFHSVILEKRSSF